MTQPLTRERILEAAEDVLRRHGPAKANVVDVARALGVSHGSVYRHFPSKQALREAVTQRWLESFHDTLDPIVADRQPDQLRRWLHALFDAKRGKALEDPELFATYVVAAGGRQRRRRRARRDADRPAHADRRRRAHRAGDLPGHDPLPPPRARRRVERPGGRSDLDRIIDLLQR